MDKNSKSPDKNHSIMASPEAKRDFSLVNYPLTPAEDAWLRQQRKRVAEVFQQSLSHQQNQEKNDE